MPMHIAEPSWKLELMKKLTDKLYGPVRTRYHAESEHLLEEHRDFKKIGIDIEVYTYFEGTSYYIPSRTGDSYSQEYIDLDPKFHKNMRIIIRDAKELEEEIAEFKLFLRKLFNECVNQADVAAVLPKSFFRLHNAWWTPHLSKKQIEKLRKENQYYISLIQKRMVENLLEK